ncbi:MAG: uracil-DNA glycosylase [Holosporaceae bacterium]|jgi:DNA polymerase|nr:uracil-DNA glycosylase [Holosporaceae bacterium]
MQQRELKKIARWFRDAGVSDIAGDIPAIRRKTSRSIATLAELKEAMQKVDIPLKKCARNMVFGAGDEHAQVLLLGEAPGEEEDKQGLPFVGQSGQLLNTILATVGLDRATVYITNILPWRPPGNRTPTNQEIEMFRPYVLKHIELIDPKVVVCLGGTSTKALLQTTQGIMQLRGKWTRVDGIAAKIMPTFHPAFLLRSPSQKKETWHDFLQIAKEIRSENATLQT